MNAGIVDAMMRFISRLVLFVAVLAVVGSVWAYFFSWRSPDTFPISKDRRVEYALVSWEEYDTAAAKIKPPYLFRVDPLKEGAVFLFGAEHGRLPGDAQFRMIIKTWEEFQPTIALVEGRMGFLLPYLMDPVETFGESGQVAALARKARLPLFSWELSKKDEIAALRRTHSREQVALFIILRPYWGSVENNFRLQNADEIVSSLIKDRGDRVGIRGTITSIEDIDRIWARDFPTESDWRDTGFGTSMPGYTGELFEQANNVRDEHMLSTIMDLTGKGERVYVSAGWSHVVRIEPVFAKDND